MLAGGASAALVLRHAVLQNRLRAMKRQGIGVRKVLDRVGQADTLQAHQILCQKRHFSTGDHLHND